MSSLALAEPAPPARWAATVERRPMLVVLAMWMLASAVMLFLFRDKIATLTFMDTDDAMRLQQVRDWVAGQPWFDVSQHRVNPPTGGPMHWSRIVDMPIAATILLLRPFVGAAGAEMLACALVPLMLLGALCATLFQFTRRLAGTGVALFSVALLLVTPTILIQFPPLRVDHHGWQILMAGLALLGALDERGRRGGMIAGAAIAVWLLISTEGLPYAALFGGLFVLRHLIDVSEGARLRAYAAMLAGAGVPLLIATRGVQALWLAQCDAFTAVYAWPLVGFAAILLAGHRLVGEATVLRRLTVAGVGGVVALGVLLWISGPCLTSGPFHDLTPLARVQWYERVMEGRPIWEQSPSLMGVSLAPMLFGLLATMLAVRAAPDAAARRRWLIVALLLAGAMAVALLVMRGMMVAHLYALPATAWLLARSFRRAQGLPHALARVPASVALCLLTPVGLSSAFASIVQQAETPGDTRVNCRTPAALARLNDLPPSLLFAPLDLGPDILVRTPHSIIGTGHHRNVIGINSVTRAFLATPDGARADVMGTARGGPAADYVLICPGMNEVLLYKKDAPGGLAAVLSNGGHPDWLEPVPGKGPLQIYKVRR